MDERRKFPRTRVGNEFTTIRTSSNVQVVEISGAGVLLRTSRPFAPGTKGALRLNLRGTPFTGSLEVRRVSPAPDSSLSYHIGAAFVGVTPENAQLLARFISQ